MKKLLLCLALLACSPANAQTAQESIAQSIGNLVIQNAQLNERLKIANDTIERLTKELAEAKKPAAPPK